MGIGTTLQHLITQNQTNVNELALATGISPSTLYSIIKRDSMRANIEDLYKVAHYFGVTLDYFYEHQWEGALPAGISSAERKLLDKFRELDAYSQQTVSLLLDREYHRVIHC